MGIHEAAPHGHGGIELDRLLLFSDAVFAIAITLLVLELKVPDRESIRSGGELLAALGAEVPKFAAFFISFAVIGVYWFVHHRMFRYIRRCDDGLVGLNLVLLLFVAFLPFPVALFGSFRREPAAVAFYVISMAVTGLTLNLLWWYATRKRRLVAPDLDRAVVRFVQFRAAAPAFLFVTSLPFAFTQAAWTMFSMPVALVALRILGGRLGRAAREAETRAGAGVATAPAVAPAPVVAPPRAAEPGPAPGA